MRGKWKMIGLILPALAAIACIAVWLAFRHPYEVKYFTPEIQAKYPTVESVLDAWRIGWKCDSPEHAALVSEVYGYGSPDRRPQITEMEPVKTISYSKDGQLAFVVTERSMWTFVMRKNRWVFYPETPWFMFVEMAHSR